MVKLRELTVVQQSIGSGTRKNCLLEAGSGQLAGQSIIVTPEQELI